MSRLKNMALGVVWECVFAGIVIAGGFLATVSVYWLVHALKG